MFHRPEYCHNVSLRLSNVLDDIGVNERCILKQRRCWMLKETIESNTLKTLKKNDYDRFYFGSTVEGTSTHGLHGLFSDVNLLLCSYDINVVSDLNDCKPGKHNLLIVQDETTAPGYCKLQLLSDNSPFILQNYFTTIDKHGREQKLLKNDMFIEDCKTLFFRGGSLHMDSHYNLDVVPALYCYPWAISAQSRLEMESIRSWPSADLRISASNTGCLLIPIGTTGIEWRMSTALADRHFMFSLNITQIRCYVLMKMIVKTYLSEFFDTISSYLIKTVLFYCLQMTSEEVWQENSLLTCLDLILRQLFSFISMDYCPHFILKKTNIIRGRIDINERQIILRIIKCLIESKGKNLLDIQLDYLGNRLQIELNNSMISSIGPTQNCLSIVFDNKQDIFLAVTIFKCYKTVLETVLHGSSMEMTLNIQQERQHSINAASPNKVMHQIKKFLLGLVRIYREGNDMEKEACKYLAPLFVSTVGSVKASEDIYTHGNISQEAHSWLSAGLNSDVLSGRLKLASALYCSGDITGSEILLKETLFMYTDKYAQPFCGCQHALRTYDFNMSKKKAYCILFLRCEQNCVPKELRYEMCRSSKDDMFNRHDDKYWMDCAMVDSLPYLYFLQYKIYKHLGYIVEQQQALSKLTSIIFTEKNICHRETALNLLGQCMEKENRLFDALLCYRLSVQVCWGNNAANIHICRLLVAVQNQRTYDVQTLTTERSPVASTQRTYDVQTLTTERSPVASTQRTYDVQTLTTQRSPVASTQRTYGVQTLTTERSPVASTQRTYDVASTQRTYDVQTLTTERSTVASCGREQQHNSSNSAGGPPDAQSACGHQSSNLFKKDFENTLAEKLVDDMSIKMKSVGAIVCDGVRGTVFRVGSKYVMTALHVVLSITNPRKRHDIPENDWSKLEEPTVWATFAASAVDLQSPPFYLKRDVIFMDKRLDVAVLELKPGNILPRKLQLSKDMGLTEHVNLIGFGHPTDVRKQLDANCKLVTVTDELFRSIQTETENIVQRWSLRPILQLHGIDPNLLTGSYNELFDRERFVCHAAMEHGASGAPAIAGNEVVGLFVKGLPTFYYELRRRQTTAQYVQNFPNQLKFELCTKTDYVYRILRHTNPMLADDLFD